MFKEKIAKLLGYPTREEYTILYNKFLEAQKRKGFTDFEVKWMFEKMEDKIVAMSCANLEQSVHQNPLWKKLKEIKEENKLE